MKYEDEVKGKGKQVKGAVKEQLGKLTGNRDLETAEQPIASKETCRKASVKRSAR